jgi:uncharacterized repeat protein (TIGR04044 family)
MADIVGERVNTGDTIVNHEEKVFPDHQAGEGDKAFIFLHTVPFESSASLVNLLTATRVRRKGFETHVVLFGPASLLAAATRGYPNVGDEAFPGNQTYNNQIKTLLKEGAHVYACRFSAAALYGMREIDMIEGVQPINPKDVLDAAITAWQERALTINTWTV